MSDDGSALVIEGLKEALREIKNVTKSKRVVHEDGSCSYSHGSASTAYLLACEALEATDGTP